MTYLLYLKKRSSFSICAPLQVLDHYIFKYTLISDASLSCVLTETNRILS